MKSMKRFLDRLFSGIFSPKEVSFIVWFFIIFLTSSALLSLIGLLPSELKTNSTSSSQNDLNTRGIQGAGQTPSSNSALGILRGTSNQGSQNQKIVSQKVVQVGIPVRLMIPSLQVDSEIIRPNTTSIAVLDSALQKGPVYYPGSGTINSGNIFIFGHSTNRSVVLNPAYKVFNNLQSLKEGDSIFIDSEGKRFRYTVKTVSKVDKNEALVKFDTSRHLLTLSTCDSFGAKSDRYVVTAEFAGQF